MRRPVVIATIIVIAFVLLGLGIRFSTSVDDFEHVPLQIRSFELSGIESCRLQDGATALEFLTGGASVRIRPILRMGRAAVIVEASVEADTVMSLLAVSPTARTGSAVVRPEHGISTLVLPYRLAEIQTFITDALNANTHDFEIKLRTADVECSVRFRTIGNGE
jgi:hypothetical protein